MLQCLIIISRNLHSSHFSSWNRTAADCWVDSKLEGEPTGCGLLWVFLPQQRYWRITAGHVIAAFASLLHQKQLWKQPPFYDFQIPMMWPRWLDQLIFLVKGFMKPPWEVGMPGGPRCLPWCLESTSSGRIHLLQWSGKPPPHSSEDLGSPPLH